MLNIQFSVRAGSDQSGQAIPPNEGDFGG